VRVNGLGTRWALADLLAVARCPRLDMILLPKVETAGDVVFLDRLLTGLELEVPRTRPLGIEILIETTKGLANVEAIAAASPRLEGIIFGVGDYSIELENLDTVLGAPNPEYQGCRSRRRRPMALCIGAYRKCLPGLWAPPNRWPVHQLWRSRCLWRQCHPAHARWGLKANGRFTQPSGDCERGIYTKSGTGCLGA